MFSSDTFKLLCELLPKALGFLHISEFLNCTKFIAITFCNISSYSIGIALKKAV